MGFSTKKGFKIRDPRISWYPFGTKNHEMRGPPVAENLVRVLPNIRMSPIFYIQCIFHQSIYMIHISHRISQVSSENAIVWNEYSIFLEKQVHPNMYYYSTFLLAFFRFFAPLTLSTHLWIKLAREFTSYIIQIYFFRHRMKYEGRSCVLL